MGLSYLFCEACCWSLFAPLFIDCKLGETDKAFNNLLTGVKYCVFGLGLSLVSPCDGLYSCFKIITMILAEGSEGVKTYGDLLTEA